MNDLKIINEVGVNSILEEMSSLGAGGTHFTNGTYAYSADLIVPTTLAGFSYLSDNHSNASDVFVIAVNSDKSMAGIMDEKNATQAERDNLEGQIVRAKKVAEPLAEAHPDRKIVVVFYDEATPTPLYDALAESQSINLKTLHKWGYGTDPKAPKIEGAHNFQKVLAFPLPNDTKPVCHDITVHEDQSNFVQVVKLTEVDNKQGVSYAPKFSPNS